MVEQLFGGFRTRERLHKVVLVNLILFFMYNQIEIEIEMHRLFVILYCVVTGV